MNLTDKTFKKAVEEATGVVVVDFWRPDCGPCNLLAPTIEKLAAEFQGRVAVYKVNIEDGPKAAARYGVTGFPTVILFKDGKVKNRFVGRKPRAVIAKMIEELLNDDV